MRHSRKTLIKMPNGRHRVASAAEVAAQKAVKELEGEVSQAQAMLRSAQARISRAKEDGATEILRAKYLPEQLELMRRELVQEFGKRAAKPIAQLLASERSSNYSLYDLRALGPADSKMIGIRGTIPELNYQFYVDAP